MDSQITLLVVGFVLTQAGLYLESRRRARRSGRQLEELNITTHEAADSAALAARRSEPTSNGFASAVLSALDSIKSALEDVRLGNEKLRLEFEAHVRVTESRVER